MKIRAERKPLADALAWVASALPKRPMSAVMAGMRLSVVDGVLIASAYDYETSHQATIDVDASEDGECLVSGSFLAMVVGQLRGDLVELVLDGSRLSITSGRAKYQAATMKLEDYPTMPAFPPVVGQVGADALASIVAKVAGPAGDEREGIAGIHLEGDGSADLWAVGSDDEARSVHSASTEWEQEAPLDTTVTTARLQAAIKGMSGTVTIGADEGTFGLSDDARTVTLRPYAVPYLKGRWRSVVDTQASKVVQTFEIATAPLAEAVKRVGALSADKDARMVGVTIDEDLTSTLLRITASDNTGGGEEVLEVENASDQIQLGMSFGMNSQLFAMALAACGPRARIGLGEPRDGDLRSAVVLEPLDGGGRFLVMPRRFAGSAA